MKQIVATIAQISKMDTRPFGQIVRWSKVNFFVTDGACAKELSRVGVIKKEGNSFWGLRWPHELHTFDEVAKSGQNCEKWPPIGENLKKLKKNVMNIFFQA